MYGYVELLGCIFALAVRQCTCGVECIHGQCENTRANCHNILLKSVLVHLDRHNQAGTV